MINTTLNLIDDLYNFARSFRSPTLTIKAQSTTCQAATQVYKSFDFFTVPIANLQLVADILPVSKYSFHGLNILCIYFEFYGYNLFVNNALTRFFPWEGGGGG